MLTKRLAMILCAAMLSIAGLPSTAADSLESGQQVPLPCDFNGDGYEDAAIGVPGEAIEDRRGAVTHHIGAAGAIHILYGTANGLTADSSRFWRTIRLRPELVRYGERFGETVDCGDYNADGYGDLVVGSPRFDDERGSAGAITVFYGAAEGLTVDAQELLHRDSPGVAGKQSINAQFGKTLTSGDFNGDGFDDLTVGAPYDRVGGIRNVGSFNVFYGSPEGLSTETDYRWHVDRPGMEGDSATADSTTAAMAAGDFDGDGYDDVVFSSYFSPAHVMFGSPSGLTALGNRRLGIEGQPLASGDLNGDGYDDIAIGQVYDPVVSDTVNVIPGSANGPDAEALQIWHRDVPGMQGKAEHVTWFGRGLTIGRFNNDEFEDLAIGALGRDGDPHGDSGTVHVIYGTSRGLTAEGNQIWHQDRPDVKNKNETDDGFGSQVRTGDFDGNGVQDLLISVPYEDGKNVRDKGRVAIIFGYNDRLTAQNNQTWSQSSPGIRGVPERGDAFGGRRS